MYNNPRPRKATPPRLQGLEARFNALPIWARIGIIGLNTLIVIALGAVFISLLSASFSPSKQPDTAAQVSTPTVVSTEASTPTMAPPTVNYPPTTEADLRTLAARGDANAIHEFHSESVGLATCPQPKREITVDPSITGQQLAEDLLAYFYAQHLSNDCGSVVFAYHDQNEAGDAYTAGRVLLDINGSKHEITLDIGGLGANQEHIITY